MWAIVELNLWVIVASIPSLRPLATRTLRDLREYRSQSRAKSYTYGSGSSKGFRARVWPSKAPSSARPGGHLASNGADTGGADSSHSLHAYNIKVSAGIPKERRWTPLSIAGEGKNFVQLWDLDGIQIDREIEVSQTNPRIGVPR